MIEALIYVIHTGNLTAISAKILFAIHIILLQIGGPVDPTWPIILLIAALGFLVYILFGVILIKKETSIVPHITENKYSAVDAEYILLVGSETGGTQIFAQQLFSQLINSGLKCYNRYE